MAADLFPPAGLVMPNPDWGFREAPEADVTKIKLGDGYEFRQPKGLNHIRETFNPTWSDIDPDVGQQAKDFIKPRLDLKAVRWMHPVRKVLVQVLPTAVSLEYDQWNNAILSITFVEDFNPV